MKKTGFIFLLTGLAFTAFGQQFLWSTLPKEGEKQVPFDSVTEKVLKFYDHYKLYYDYTGYSKERFIEEIGEEFDVINNLNDITKLTVYAGKSNLGYGSIVMVACVSEKNVDLIVFSNKAIEGDLSYESTDPFERERFVRWFRTLIHKDGDFDYQTVPIESGALYPGTSAGDAGDPYRSVDSRALYGTGGGGGGGSSLDLAGWKWDNEPKPIDNSSEDGKIVFEIKVDDNGEVFGVRTLQATVSSRVVKIYRKEVEKLTFSPISGNAVPAPINVGMITFIIRSK